jgi:hypothetical protein
MQSYLSLAERVSAIQPGSIDKTDWDRYLEESAEMVSLPAKVVRTDDEVAAIRKQIADQQAQQQQQMAMAQGVDNINKLGNTPSGDGTALDVLEKETAGNA